MSLSIKNVSHLRKILWLDTFLGGITALIGLCFFHPLEQILGLSVTLIISVSAITGCYAIVAFILAKQKTISIPLLRVLIFANWFWAIVSIALVLLFFKQAYLLGKIFLILQVLVVSGLAYIEGKQIEN
ncbi:MAG: hypothetical protein ACR2MX_13885 [Cyclobacteriaceae bacterium]